MTLSPKLYNEIVNLCLDGLNIDGGHHKQWYLEEILKRLASPIYIKTKHQEDQWEEGIAP